MLRGREGTNYPPDATIQAKQFVIRDFVVGSSIAIFGNVTADGTKVKVIHREHDAAIHAMAAHPSQWVFIPCFRHKLHVFSQCPILANYN